MRHPYWLNPYYTKQYANHVLLWAGRKREKRFWNVWYRGKVTRTYQLNQLRAHGDDQGYRWIKDFWRRELTECR